MVVSRDFTCDRRAGLCSFLLQFFFSSAFNTTTNKVNNYNYNNINNINSITNNNNNNYYYTINTNNNTNNNIHIQSNRSIY